MASDRTENHAQATIGSGALILHDNKVLLVQMNYGTAKGSWILPGGMVEAGEHPTQTAQRETLEETNLNITVGKLISVRHRIQKNNTANVYYVFLGHLTEAHNSNPDKDIQWPEEELMNVRFWDIDECMQSKEVRPLTKEYLKHFLDHPDKGLQNTHIPEVHTLNDELFCV